MKQLSKTLRSTTPPPGLDTSSWKKSNNLLIHFSDAPTPERLSRPEDHPQVEPVAKVQIMLGHGGEEEEGEIVDKLLRTGRYDEVVRNYVRELDGGAVAEGSNLQVEAYSGHADIDEFIARRMEQRAIAETQPSREDIAADANIGSSRQEMSADDAQNMFSNFM